jgi:hypothetical protein
MVCGTIAAAMTPDIVANGIVAALCAGAVSGASDTAKSAIADVMDMLEAKPDTMHAPPRKYD